MLTIAPASRDAFLADSTIGVAARAVEERGTAPDGARLLRRTYRGVLAAAGADAVPERAAAAREIWHSLVCDALPNVAVLRAVEIQGDDLVLVYDAFDGSLADWLDVARPGRGAALPLPAALTLRSLLVAASACITGRDWYGLSLRRGLLEPASLLVSDGVPCLPMSAFEWTDAADGEHVSVASFGAVLCECLTGEPSVPGRTSAARVAVLRPGLPDTFVAAAEWFLESPAGVAALAERCAIVRRELRRLFGAFPCAKPRPDSSAAETARYQLGLLPVLERLGADHLIDRYFDELGARARVDLVGAAERAWRARRILPPVHRGPACRPSPPGARDGDAAHAFLVRAARARRESDPATALVAWRLAVCVAPADPEVWLEFARLWAGLECEGARAFGLSEALACARGEAAVLDAIGRTLGATTRSDVAAYFEHHGHGPMASWVRAWS
jgi:hypothetical protein